MLGEIFPFTRIKYPFVEIDQPPQGIGGDAVDPSGQCRIVRGQRKRTVDLRNVSENVFGRFHFGSKISDPNETVALDAVPDFVLQAKMAGIRRRIVDLIQTSIIGFKASDIFIGMIGHDRLNGFDIDFCRCQTFDINESEARGTAFRDRPAFRADLKIAHAVIVGRTLFSDVRECFSDRFSEGNAEGGFLSVTDTEEGKANAAVYFRSEVEQNARLFFFG